MRKKTNISTFITHICYRLLVLRFSFYFYFTLKRQTIYVNQLIMNKIKKKIGTKEHQHVIVIFVYFFCICVIEKNFDFVVYLKGVN